MTRPRVLAVTSEPPWPLNSGGHLRSFHLLKALSMETELRLVCPVQPSQREAIPALVAEGIDVLAVPVRARSMRSEAGRLIGALGSGEPYVMYRRHSWPAVAMAWEDQLQRHSPDVVYLDHLDSALLLPPPGAPKARPSVLDLHNSYSLLVSRAADEESNPVKRAFLKREARLLSAMERRASARVDIVQTVSDEEAASFRTGGADVHVVPNGVDCRRLADLPVGRDGPPTILFLGTMSWGPNAGAARFLAMEVLPSVRRRVPAARLLVVGRDPSAELLALNGQPGIEVTGSVDDIKPYLRTATLLAVPLEAGGGTRLKILEAFAAGMPVVSTAVGAEGIAATPGLHFALAERLSFPQVVVDMLTQPAVGARMAKMARKLAWDRYDWPRIGALSVAIVQRLAAGRAQRVTSTTSKLSQP